MRQVERAQLVEAAQRVEIGGDERLAAGLKAERIERPRRRGRLPGSAATANLFQYIAVSSFIRGGWD